jgi:ATP-dependent DNA helicase RecQ
MATLDIHGLLKKYWGFEQFRPMQEEIIQSVLEGQDTLALLPTGGGKSLCFQVPALYFGGLCVVISPLIALMKDQVEQLQKRGIQAMAVFSGMSNREIDLTLDMAVFGKLQFLYVSPERLQTNLFKERAKRMKIKLLAIDEAHCISQWGYDFRPSYLEIIEFRNTIPDVPCIALTATATLPVQKDIQEKLQFRKAKLFQKSFARPNLSYSCIQTENKEGKLLEILQKVQGSAVVYLQSRKKTQQIALWLQKNGIRADFYHAGLTNDERNNKQNDWIANRSRVMVATNAFGMGIDKPDVRTVVHLDLTSSLEAYYQEAGRAGRDEKKAYAVVLFNQKDIDDLRKNTQQQYPDLTQLKDVYQRLANFFQLAIGSHHLSSFDFEISDFCKQYELNQRDTYFALKQLEQQGLIQLSESFYTPSRFMFRVDNTQLYEFQVANAKMDVLIKTILRMYGGELFIHFSRISEGQISRQLKVETNLIIKQLQFLEQSGIGVYSPQKDKAQLTFTTPRQNADHLPIDYQDLIRRKQKDEEKTEAVIRYVNHQHRCRTLILLDYFGELSNERCGVCDICVQAKREQKLINNGVPDFADSIFKALKYTALSIHDLGEELQIQAAHKTLFLNQVQAMISTGELQQNRDGDLEIRKKR